jgi:hypothetical protein
VPNNNIFVCLKIDEKVSLQESVYDHQEVKQHIRRLPDDIKDKLANNELEVRVGIYNPAKKSYLFKLSKSELGKFSTEELYRLLPRDVTKKILGDFSPIRIHFVFEEVNEDHQGLSAF